MSSNLKWHFPSTDKGDEDGINDSIREVFEGDHERFVARESIQNSLDARLDGSKPVKVTFERFNLPVNQIPGLKELEDILARAHEYSKDQDKSDAFYLNAIKLLKSPTIPVLKVSDYNTTGLSGDDQDKTGGWYKLIRSSGVNSMAGVGGGSYGIGKGAPFAASGIRTVFYSTVNDKDEHAFQGKARLSSFKNNDGDVRRGVGQFGNQIDRGVNSIRVMSDIPEFFRRTEQGTDLYIIGYMTQEEDWTRLLLNSLLNNFWAAVHFNDLDVELIDNGKIIHTVDETNLEVLMDEYASEEGGSYTFYKAVESPTKTISAVLPNLKDVTLYIKTGENYPKSVQMMRQSKMVVDTLNNYRVLPEPYAAVFLCMSNEGNKLLRELEPPAHDKWDPERNKVFGNKVHKELIKWIRDSLRSMAEDKEVTPEDIPELSQWLPDIEERDDMNPYLGSNGSPTERQSDLETAKEVGASRETTNTSAMEVKNREVALTQNYSRGEGVSRLGTKSITNKTHKDQVDTDIEGNLPRINTANIRFRAREIHKNGQRLYQAVLSTTEVENGAIKILAVGDDNDYPVEIEDVTDVNGKKVKFTGPLIKDLDLKPNEPIKLFIALKDKKRYALGVESHGY